MNPLLDKLKELRDEFELLNTMADAERLSKTKEARDCTDEQATRTGDTLSKCIALAQAQGEQRGEWISVKERLPKAGQRKLLVVANGKVSSTTHGYESHWMDMRVDRWIPDLMSVHTKGVTHWMELPPPPSTTGS